MQPTSATPAPLPATLASLRVLTYCHGYLEKRNGQQGTYRQPTLPITNGMPPSAKDDSPSRFGTGDPETTKISRKVTAIPEGFLGSNAKSGVHVSAPDAGSLMSPWQDERHVAVIPEIIALLYPLTSHTPEDYQGTSSPASGSPSKHV